MKSLNLFIGSPKDCHRERKTLLGLCRSITSRNPAGIEIKPLYWDSLIFHAGDSFQDQIDSAIQRAEIDIAIFIFFSKIGSPFRKDGIEHPSATHYEIQNMIQSYERRGRPKIYVLWVRDEKLFLRGLAKASDEQCAAAFQARAALARYIRKHFSDEQGQNVVAYNSSDCRTKTRECFSRILEESLADMLPSGISLAPEFDSNPFVGLKSYSKEDADYYFGREIEIEEALGLICDSLPVPLLVLGTGGVGKSSFAKAGVAVALAEYLDQEGLKLRGTTAIRPSDSGTAPAATILSALDDLGIRLIKTRGTEVMHFPGTLNERHVLVVDQLEEIFSESYSDAERNEFFRVLLVLAESGRIYIVATLRADFFEHLHGALLPSEFRKMCGKIDLDPLQPAQVKLIVQKLCQRSRLCFESNRSGSLLDQIVLDSAQLGSLTLFQFTLSKLYENRRGNLLTFEAYHRIGKVTGALTTIAEDAFNKLGATDQSLCPSFFRSLVLVNSNGTTSARAKRLGTDHNASRFANIIKAFDTAQIITCTQQSTGQSITILHESVFKHWNRLAGWISDEKEALQLQSRLRTFMGAAADDSPSLLEFIISARNLLDADWLEPDELRFLFECALIHDVDVLNWAYRFSQVQVDGFRTSLLSNLVAQNPIGLSALNAAMVAASLGESDVLRNAISITRDSRGPFTQIETMSRGIVLSGNVAILDEILPQEGAGGTSEILTAFAASQRRSVRRAESHLTGFPLWSQIALLFKSVKYPLAHSWRSLLFALMPAIGLASIAAGLFKAIPGAFNIAVCQVSGQYSAPMGAFHGIAAAVIWGGGITLSVLLAMCLLCSHPSRWTHRTTIWISILGGLTGFICGLLITFVILGVYSEDNIYKIGWLASKPSRFSLDFLYEVFVVTRMGLVYPVSGFFLGVAFSRMYCHIFSNPAISIVLPYFESRTHIPRPFLSPALGIAFRKLPEMAMILLAGTLVTCLVPNLTHSTQKYAHGTLDLVIHLSADTATQLIGAIACIIGCIAGFYVAKVGVQQYSSR